MDLDSGETSPVLTVAARCLVSWETLKLAYPFERDQAPEYDLVGGRKWSE